MINLAGHKDCDRYIRDELTRCGIDVVERAPSGGEVNATLSGKLGAFTFQRAWTYWVVSGLVPLDIAKRLYEHRVGRTDIRVGGHCGCPAPGDYGTIYIDADGVRLASDPTGEEARTWDNLAPKYFPNEPRPHFVPNAADHAVSAHVDGYHIDSELGLYVFVEAVRPLGAGAVPA